MKYGTIELKPKPPIEQIKELVHDRGVLLDALNEVMEAKTYEEIREKVNSALKKLKYAK